MKCLYILNFLQWNLTSKKSENTIILHFMTIFTFFEVKFHSFEVKIYSKKGENFHSFSRNKIFSLFF